MSRRSYVTTPIYYVNDRPHIGHVFTTLLADVWARHRRLRGDEVFFLTGTDEHAAKVVDAAARAGLSTEAWADRNARTFQETFAKLGLEPDDFIRTTEERHKARVRRYVELLLASGDVYAGEYEGWYDPGQEEYVPENKARENDFKSAVDKRPLVRKKEQNYFFRLSAYREELLARYADGTFAVRPEARKNEVLARVREVLLDVPVSRTGSVDWGIRMPGDDAQTIYVWIDALFNYLTTVDTDERRGFWPPDVQYLGKDILWFHAVIWPALLMALAKSPGMEWVKLPRCIYVHSHWTSEGQKMSKSLGNSIGLEQLDELVATFGLDALRWFLVTRGPVATNDSDFARARFLEVYNSELANALGNCTSRVVNMTQRWFGGRVPGAGPDVEGRASLLEAVEAEITAAERAVDGLDLPAAAEAGLRIVRAVDLFIDRSRPFELAKNPAELPAVGSILSACAEALRVASLLLWPVLPTRMEELWRRIGRASYADALANHGHGNLESWLREDPLQPGTELLQGEPLYPRLKAEDVLTAAVEAPPQPAAPAPKASEPAPKAADAVPERVAIAIEQFQALDLRIARVVAASLVPKADRLLQLELELANGERRTVLSGIRASYGPEELEGREVLYLANLAPRKIRGVESQGMVLAGHDAEGRPVLLRPDREVPPGSHVS